MAKRKTKIKFFTIADYRKEEKWLEKEYESGWKLIKMIPPCFFVFEECIPEKAIYQLECKNERVTEDYIQMYKDYGWEYLGSCFGWNYFRKIESKKVLDKEREIFSDTDSKISMIEHIFRTRILLLLFIFCVVIIPNVFRFSGSEYRLGDIEFGVFYLIMFSIYIYIFIYCGLKLRKLKKELER